MKVELLGFYGGDKSHALSAWTSTSRDYESKRDRMPQLLAKLASEGHHCYDPETEILTENGWKYFYNLSYNDKVATVDIITKEVKFEIPHDIFCDDYNDNLYHIKGQQLDLLVTNGHRMVVSQKRNPKQGFGDYEFQTVAEVKGTTRKYLKAGQINNESKLTPDFAKLLGFFIGDGHASTTNTISFHIKKQREVTFLNTLDFKIKENKNNKFDITQQNLGKWFKENCYTNEGEKKLPSDYLHYSKEDFDNIFEGLKNSDGTKKRNTFVYYTTSVLLKDQLLALASVHNSVFTVSKTYWSNEKWKPLFRLTLSNRVLPEVALSQKNRSLTYVEDDVFYCGKVYCVSVSTGAVIVKRNDKVVVSGNTPFEKSSLHFLVCAEQVSHIHLLKHRIGVAINGESARYKELKEDKFYLPKDWIGIKTSEAHIINHFGTDDWYDIMEKATTFQNYLYHESLKDATPILGRKRAKESARYFKTMNSELVLDVMFNFRSFVHFLSLRHKEEAQLEIYNIAEEMLNLVKAIPAFKYSLKAFGL